jgi:hypothetical protein
MIPCYVSGKGMFASETTWDFKTHVMQFLQKEGLGYDTRHQYYRQQFPDMDEEEFARMICDPVEYYDKNWPTYLQQHRHEKEEWKLATEFMLRLDLGFQAEAQIAIYCFDEAGFGSGVNNMRFLQNNKPVIGFYHQNLAEKNKNMSNFFQLSITHPKLFHCVSYQQISDIDAPLKKSLIFLKNH